MVKFVSFRILVSFLCVLSGLCVKISAQEFKTLKDGIEYAEVTQEISGLKVNMNLLRLDLTKVRLDVNHALDAAIGTEKTSSIATRHGAFAAINAGFFRLDTSIFAGDAAGALKIDHNVLSESGVPRVALFIDNRSALTNVDILRLGLDVDILIGKDGYLINGVNREMKENDLVIYTPEFARTTLTDPSTMEIIVRKDRIVGFSDHGGSVIPSDGFVISGSGPSRSLIQKFAESKKKVVRSYGALSQIDPQTGYREPASKILAQTEDIVAGVPQLIKDSKIDITWEQEKSSKSFVETRHPRTAVAKFRDGKFLMITVDGRTESSGGIGLQDLAEYLLSLGATDAMNLDGGGSTTMFVEGKVVNHPSDKEGERKVSDAILVTLRKK